LSDSTRHCWYFLRADQAAVAAWLALAACCPLCFAQNISPVQATSLEGTSGSLPQNLCGSIPTPIQSPLLPVAPVVLPGSPVFAESSLNPPEEKPPEKERTSHQDVLLPHWAAKRFVASETHEKPNQGRAMIMPTTCAGLAGSSLGEGKEVK